MEIEEIGLLQALFGAHGEGEDLEKGPGRGGGVERTVVPAPVLVSVLVPRRTASYLFNICYCNLATVTATHWAPSWQFLGIRRIY